MRVIFMGTPDFAVPCLESLIRSDDEVVAVFTQPDKKKGRNYMLAPPPIKELALKYGIKVFQPESLKDIDTIKLILELNPDLIVVVAYGKILPKEILNIPPFGCVNVHASLLPKYRGAAPIQWAIINGENITGVTTMYMDAGLDTGDIILKSETKIRVDETSGELFDRLSTMGSKLLIKTLNVIKSGEVKRERQIDKYASYAPMLDKSVAKINWKDSADKINNLVRGLNPCPVARTDINGKLLKIYKTKVYEPMCGRPGEVKSVKPLVVACGNNSAIEILNLQLESKKRMSSEDFFRGHKINIGLILS